MNRQDAKHNTTTEAQRTQRIYGEDFPPTPRRDTKSIETHRAPGRSPSRSFVPFVENVFVLLLLSLAGWASWRFTSLNKGVPGKVEYLEYRTERPAMFTCPTCRTAMTRVASPHGLFYGCTACRGRAVTLPILRKQIDNAFLRGLWRDARAGQVRRGRPCPSCARPMAEFTPEGGAHDLDVCAGCHLVWFDPAEYEALPEAPSTPAAAVRTPKRDLPPEAVEQLARAQMQLETARHRQRTGAGEEPDAWWKYGLALMGVPVETDAPAVGRLPLVTWAIGAVMVLTALFTFGDLQYYVDEFGLIPAQAGRDGGLTFLTSFFLHGGIAHLLGNLYFLIVFGDNVEDYLGKGWYLLLIVLAAVAGDAAHMAFEPRGAIPSIGASGGISGIIVFYALAFPRARLGFFFRFYFYPKWFTLPAIGFVGFWILMQFIGTYSQLAGFSNVSALAHLGGAAVGLVVWFARGR